MRAPRKTAVVKKYKDGKLVSVETLVKHKGKYMRKEDIPKAERGSVNQSFFREALSKMSDVDADKVSSYLKSFIG